MDAKELDDHITKKMPDSINNKRRAHMNFLNATAKIHSGFIAQEVQQAAMDAGFISSVVSIPSDSNGIYALTVTDANSCSSSSIFIFISDFNSSSKHLSKPNDNIIGVSNLNEL